MGYIYRIGPDGEPIGEPLITDVPEDFDRNLLRTKMEQSGTIKPGEPVGFIREPVPSLSGQLAPGANLPAPSPDLSPEAQRETLRMVGDVANTGLTAAKFIAPMATANPAIAPIAAGGRFAVSYLIPELTQRALQYSRGEPVGEKEILESLGGGAGMFVGGAFGQAAPTLGEAVIRRGIGPVGQALAQWGIETGANMAGTMAQKAVEQKTIFPSLPSTGETLLNVGTGFVSSRGSLAQARGAVLDKELDAVADQLAAQLPHVSWDDRRRVAAILSDDPEHNRKIIDLVFNDPSRIPKMAESGAAIAKSAVSDLGDTAGQSGIPIPAPQAEFPSQGEELKSALKAAARSSGDVAETQARTGMERVLQRPLDVSPVEAEEAVRVLQTDVARKVAAETQAFENQVTQEVDSVIQSVAPGVTRADAIEGTAELGKKALGMVKSSMQAKQARKNLAYDSFYAALEATPAVANAPAGRFNDVVQDTVKAEMKEALEMFGSPRLVGDVDLKNIINRFFPEIIDPNTPEAAKTVGDFIRNMPALNAAFDRAFRMTGENQLRDRANLLYILNRLDTAVNNAVDPVMAQSPQLKAAWEKARGSMKEYGDARKVFYALDQRGINAVGQNLTSIKMGLQPEDEFKNIYTVIGDVAAKDLKNAEKRNLLAQIMHSSTNPKTGALDPDMVMRKLYENENKLGNLYGSLASFLERTDYAGRLKRIRAMQGVVDGKFFSRIATDMDPDILLFAQHLNPQMTARAKAIAIDDLLKKARTPEGGFDMNAIVNDPRVQRVLSADKQGGVSVFPELSALLGGAGANLAINNATLVSEVLKRHGFSDIDGLFRTFLDSADIGGKEVKAFKDVVMQAFPGVQGDRAWADLRNTFWQRMLFNPETGSPRFDRWLNATETGYPKEFLAEMAGAGTKVYDKATKQMKTLTESDALAKVEQWTKHIRKLRDYADIFMSEALGGMSESQVASLRKLRKDEDLFAFMGGTLSTGIAGMYSAGATRYFLAKLGQYGIKEYWNGLREARLFESGLDHISDKLPVMVKAFARAAQTMIHSKLLRESGQEPPVGIPQPDK